MRGKDLFMRSLIPSLNLSKRQKFVLTVLFMSIGIFISTYLSGINLIITSIFLSFLGIILLYFTLRSDISGTFYYPILILPFFFTISFSLFYPLIPARLLTRIIVVLLYAFGLYSLFITQNIFAVSAIRTITLLRSARIVSFVLTIVVLFLLTNIIFSLALGQLAFVLNLWPVTAAIYSIFITGIFYAYSGLTHAWIEKRLFKGILWEYVWVGFLAILILVFFSNWGF